MQQKIRQDQKIGVDYLTQLQFLLIYMKKNNIPIPNMLEFRDLLFFVDEDLMKEYELYMTPTLLEFF